MGGVNMHIIIGALVALGSILWALNRLQANGLDLNAFNPFTWFRRRKWQQAHGAKALHSIDNPMEVAAVFILGVVALEGEITREQKSYIFKIFIDEFGVSEAVAGELYASASYLIKDEIDLSGQVRSILKPSKSKFTTEMVDAVLVYMNKIANIDDEASDFQRSMIDALGREFAIHQEANQKWS